MWKLVIADCRAKTKRIPLNSIKSRHLQVIHTVSITLHPQHLYLNCSQFPLKMSFNNSMVFSSAAALASAFASFASFSALGSFNNFGGLGASLFTFLGATMGTATIQQLSSCWLLVIRKSFSWKVETGWNTHCTSMIFGPYKNSWQTIQIPQSQPLLWGKKKQSHNCSKSPKITQLQVIFRFLFIPSTFSFATSTTLGFFDCHLGDSLVNGAPRNVKIQTRRCLPHGASAWREAGGLQGRHISGTPGIRGVSQRLGGGCVWWVFRQVGSWQGERWWWWWWFLASMFWTWIKAKGWNRGGWISVLVIVLCISKDDSILQPYTPRCKTQLLHDTISTIKSMNYHKWFPGIDWHCFILSSHLQTLQSFKETIGPCGLKSATRDRDFTHLLGTFQHHVFPTTKPQELSEWVTPPC